jgi:hypothetical protein
MKRMVIVVVAVAVVGVGLIGCVQARDPAAVAAEQAATTTTNPGSAQNPNAAFRLRETRDRCQFQRAEARVSPSDFWDGIDFILQYNDEHPDRLEPEFVFRVRHAKTTYDNEPYQDDVGVGDIWEYCSSIGA